MSYGCATDSALRGPRNVRRIAAPLESVYARRPELSYAAPRGSAGQIWSVPRFRVFLLSSLFVVLLLPRAASMPATRDASKSASLDAPTVSDSTGSRDGATANPSTGHRKRSARLLFYSDTFNLRTMNNLFVSVNGKTGEVAGVQRKNTETLFEYSMLDNVRSVQLSSLYESVIPKQKIIVLKAKLTNRYICINSRGDVVSYLQISDDCYFLELIDSASQSIVLVSERYRGLPNKLKNQKRRWILGFNSHGRPRKAYRVQRRYRGAQITMEKLNVAGHSSLSVTDPLTTPRSPVDRKYDIRRTSARRKRKRKRLRIKKKARLRRLRRNRKRRRLRKLRKCIRRNGRSSSKCGRYRSAAQKQRDKEKLKEKRPELPKSRLGRLGRPQTPTAGNKSGVFVLDPLK